MNLRQLTIFRAVNKRKTLSGAAAELSITQPAVSAQMKQLATELGTPLFRPQGRRLEPTEAGDELLAYAERILSLVDEARAATLARARSGGLVRIAASSTPGVSLLPPLIARFRKKSPSTTVRLQVVNTQTVEQKLRSREADLGVVGGRLTAADLVVEPWREDELGLAVPPDHRLARRTWTAPDGLIGETLLAREHGSATRTTYEAAFLRAGFPLPEPQVLGDTEAIKHAVGAGMGISILSRFSVVEEVRAGKLKWLRVKGVELRRPLQLLYPRATVRSPAVTGFLHLLRASAAPAHPRESA
ncbi:MAG: LysR substrate-binding domain-containing protein [Candidatus Binatia bacterium]